MAQIVSPLSTVFIDSLTLRIISLIYYCFDLLVIQRVLVSNHWAALLSLWDMILTRRLAENFFLNNLFSGFFLDHTNRIVASSNFSIILCKRLELVWLVRDIATQCIFDRRFIQAT